MNRIVLALMSVLLVACNATQPIKQDLSAFRAAPPRSILVVPVVNQSLDVDAPNYLLSALPVPLAEKGYYVFPVNTTKYILEQEGFYESDRIHNEAPQVLAKMFGADAILYVVIKRWDAQYAVLSAAVTVEFDYRLINKDGIELWKDSRKVVYSPQNNNQGGGAIGALIGAMVNAAITRAAPDYMPLARQANQQALSGPNALPNGPYFPTKPVQ
ncbi:MAG TPA: GNA1162 family protein [Rhodocyclaceae bacterium]|nr:GNA1162 family protein [Rhodocyclaceae bacterium]